MSRYQKGISCDVVSPATPTDITGNPYTSGDAPISPDGDAERCVDAMEENPAGDRPRIRSFDVMKEDESVIAAISQYTEVNPKLLTSEQVYRMLDYRFLFLDNTNQEKFFLTMIGNAEASELIYYYICWALVDYACDYDDAISSGEEVDFRDIQDYVIHRSPIRLRSSCTFSPDEIYREMELIVLASGIALETFKKEACVLDRKGIGFNLELLHALVNLQKRIIKESKIVE